MTVDLHYTTNAKRVDHMLMRLDTALSPIAIGTFLGETIDPYIRSRAEQRFQNEGDDVVGKWMPLASSTQEIRAGLGYGSEHPINHRTGELERYITGSRHDVTLLPDGAMLTMPGEPASGELATKVETAQFGDPGGGGRFKTPPRPVMGVNEKDLAFVVTAIELYLGQAMEL
jgi:hypothetical protein